MGIPLERIHNRGRTNKGLKKGELMIVRMWMSKPVITVSPSSSVTKAALLMGKHHIRRVVAADTGPEGEVRVKGIVSKHDVLHAYPRHINPFLQEPMEPNDLPTVSKVMTPNVLSIHPDAPMEDAAIILRDKKIGALPVMLDRKLVGIITESDIFKALTRILVGTEETLRITFDASQDDLLPMVTEQARQHQVRITSVVSFEWKKKDMAVIRVNGGHLRAFVDWLWQSGHTVLDITPALDK